MVVVEVPCDGLDRSEAGRLAAARLRNEGVTARGAATGLSGPCCCVESWEPGPKIPERKLYEAARVRSGKRTDYRKSDRVALVSLGTNKGLIVSAPLKTVKKAAKALRAVGLAATVLEADLVLWARVALGRVQLVLDLDCEVPTAYVFDGLRSRMGSWQLPDDRRAAFVQELIEEVRNTSSILVRHFAVVGTTSEDAAFASELVTLLGDPGQLVALDAPGIAAGDELLTSPGLRAVAAALPEVEDTPIERSSLFLDDRSEFAKYFLGVFQRGTPAWPFAYAFVAAMIFLTVFVSVQLFGWIQVSRSVQSAQAEHDANHSSADALRILAQQNNLLQQQTDFFAQQERSGGEIALIIARLGNMPGIQLTSAGTKPNDRTVFEVSGVAKDVETVNRVVDYAQQHVSEMANAYASTYQERTNHGGGLNYTIESQRTAPTAGTAVANAR
jgi:hypothetical protein